MQLPFFEIALFWVSGDNLGLKRQLQPQLWYHFVFKVNFEEDLLPQFFLSVASSEVLIQRCLLMKYGTSIGGFSFKITVLNIFGKIFRKTSVRELICSMVMRFQYALCREWFFTIFRKFSGRRFLYGLTIP